MNERAQIGLLPDGRRLHMHDGPIDLIVEAFGGAGEIRTAYQAASRRFVDVLDELCAELPLLRTQARTDSILPAGRIARRMAAAVAPYAARTFITPMAAVAGAVAEEILEAMTAAAPLAKAYVNDGGDIALHLAQGENFVVGMVERPDRPSLFGTATLRFIAASSRDCHQRLARAQLLVGYRRCSDGPGRSRCGGRCGRDHHRQCG